nr:MAG TPA: hypothetical protein [Caudoviricetes sp.]
MCGFDRHERILTSAPQHFFVSDRTKKVSPL